MVPHPLLYFTLLSLSMVTPFCLHLHVVATQPSPPAPPVPFTLRKGEEQDVRISVLPTVEEVESSAI